MLKAAREAEGAALLDLIGNDDRGYDFVHDMTQREIGGVIGFSQMHVSRLLRRALSRVERATA